MIEKIVLFESSCWKWTHLLWVWTAEARPFVTWWGWRPSSGPSGRRRCWGDGSGASFWPAPGHSRTSPAAPSYPGQSRSQGSAGEFRPQVSSPTQFCPLLTWRNQGSVWKKYVFNKRTIKVSRWRCPGTSVPSSAHLTESLYLCTSSRSNVRGESRAL